MLFLYKIIVTLFVYGIFYYGCYDAIQKSDYKASIWGAVVLFVITFPIFIMTLVNFFYFF